MAILTFVPYILLGLALAVHDWDYERGVSRSGVFPKACSTDFTSLNFSTGLDTWGNVSAYCLGSSQSPIDLDASEAFHDHHHHHLMFINYEEVTKENTVFENNGHAVELKVESSKM